MHAKKTKVESRAQQVEPVAAYGRSVRLGETSAAVALERAKHAFGQEGFGVVAEIDFRDTFERTLDKHIGPYWVVEICNPSLADRALAVDHMAGLLLPCKIAVWQEGYDAVVAALRPEVATMVARNESLRAIAREAEEHIERSLVRLEAPGLEAPSATP